MWKAKQVVGRTVKLGGFIHSKKTQETHGNSQIWSNWKIDEFGEFLWVHINSCEYKDWNVYH